MKLALTGYPGSGKSTLFSALTSRRQTLAKARDEANIALLSVPDERIDRLSALYRPKKTTYAQVTIIDPPAIQAKKQEKGLRLSEEVKQADGLLLVVRNFDEGLGGPDPAAEYNSFIEELILADLISAETSLERWLAEKKKGRKVDEEALALLTQAQELLSENKTLAGREDITGHPGLRGFGFISGKPMVVIANNAEDDPEPPSLGQAARPVVVRAAIEAEIAQLPDEERAEFMADMGLEQSALDRLIRAGYEALELISFFTVGEDEVRAWTIRRGATALSAAGVIHSDLEKGFIRAEVMAQADLLRLGSEAAVKSAGLMKLAGRDHVVADGEIMHVRFNV